MSRRLNFRDFQVSDSDTDSEATTTESSHSRGRPNDTNPLQDVSSQDHVDGLVTESTATYDAGAASSPVELEEGGGPSSPNIDHVRSLNDTGMYRPSIVRDEGQSVEGARRADSVEEDAVRLDPQERRESLSSSADPASPVAAPRPGSNSAPSTSSFQNDDEGDDDDRSLSEILATPRRSASSQPKGPSLPLLSFPNQFPPPQRAAAANEVSPGRSLSPGQSTRRYVVATVPQNYPAELSLYQQRFAERDREVRAQRQTEVLQQLRELTFQPNLERRRSSRDHDHVVHQDPYYTRLYREAKTKRDQAARSSASRRQSTVVQSVPQISARSKELAGNRVKTNVVSRLYPGKPAPEEPRKPISCGSDAVVERLLKAKRPSCDHTPLFSFQPEISEFAKSIKHEVGFAKRLSVVSLPPQVP